MALPRRTFLRLTAAAAATAAIAATATRLTTTTATAAEPWWGWNPDTWDDPPLLPALPYWNNTGLWRAEDRVGLTPYGDFTTSRTNQLVDRAHIRGNLDVKHAGFKIKRSLIEGTVRNYTTSPYTLIHCDHGRAGSTPGKGNACRGNGRVLRCNGFGFLDYMMTNPGGGDFLPQDNFIHDMRYQPDSGQSGGYSHNDHFQINSTGVRATLRHNTFLCWTIDNFSSGAREACTRDSGVHWRDTNGTALGVAGVNTSRSANVRHGLMTSGALMGSGSTFNPISWVVDGNLWRGLAYSYIICGGPVGRFEIVNNLFAEDENVSGRKIVGGKRGRAEVDLWTNNRNYKTGALIP